ncbi:MAG: shikimate dehydrogenase, partial [Flavobacteriia bacterium]|nr:shikimate dehydrogenase [Flavobacteriia bacterium]
MKYFGLIGKPLGHSFSPAFFTAFFTKNRIDAQYKLVEVPNIDSIPIVLRENFHGLNVTIPYKEAIIPFLDELSPEARTVGA